MKWKTELLFKTQRRLWLWSVSLSSSPQLYLNWQPANRWFEGGSKFALNRQKEIPNLITVIFVELIAGMLQKWCENSFSLFLHSISPHKAKVRREIHVISHESLLRELIKRSKKREIGKNLHSSEHTVSNNVSFLSNLSHCFIIIPVAKSVYLD